MDSKNLIGNERKYSLAFSLKSRQADLSYYKIYIVVIRNTVLTLVVFWCINRTLTFSHCLRNGLAIWMNDLGIWWSARSLWSSFMFFSQSAVLACNCLYHSESTLTFHISVFNSFLTVLECPGESGDWGHHRKLPHRKLSCPKRTRLVGVDPPGCIQSGGKCSRVRPTLSPSLALCKATAGWGLFCTDAFADMELTALLLRGMS